MTIAELYEIFRAHPVITTDTRDCPKGALFFALKGANFDGNAFAAQALEAGCAHAVVDDVAVAATDARFILVDNVLNALQQLAHHHREALKTPIVQITGTNGKTTTKELTAAVLRERWHVLATEGNFNNHIGVPKTLLRLTEEHDIAVVETGANHPGEIAELSRIVDADCGIITNVGVAHIEGFGSFEGVVRTKGELYDFLRTKPDAFAFIHADNHHLTAIAQGLRTLTYGKPGENYDVEGEVVACNPFLCIRWRKRGGEWHEAQTQLIGAYNADNALAAAAIGLHFGVSEAQITHALMHYVPKNNRSELLRTAHNTLIVDAYNANPTSMAAALDNFKRIPHAHKVAILGHMAELGSVSEAEHRRIVDLLPTIGCEAIWLVGEHFAPFTQYPHFPDVEAVKAHLEAQPLRDKLILIKGSNSNLLFRLTDEL